MRTPLIAGNWKMYKALAEGRELVRDIGEGLARIDGVDVLVCPPYPFLSPLAKPVTDSRMMLGAQNVHEAPQGAFTGEVAAAMLVDVGCTHVIVGHSERRQLVGEEALTLARKVRAAIAAGLHVVYCVGETLEEREAGRTETIVEQHLNEVINRDVPADRVTIAYEPVWAIGTGKTATPEEAQQVHAQIRAQLAMTYDQPSADNLRILYGGSVKPGAAPTLLRQPDIDGALVGGACLVAKDFLAIMSVAASQAAMT